MSTAIEIWQVLGFAIPLFQARIRMGVSALHTCLQSHGGSEASALPIAKISLQTHSTGAPADRCVD